MCFIKITLTIGHGGVACFWGRFLSWFLDRNISCLAGRAAALFENHVLIIQVSFGSNLAIFWESCGILLNILWASFGNHFGRICASFGNHLWISWTPFGIPLEIIWESFCTHFDIMLSSLGNHNAIRWAWFWNLFDMTLARFGYHLGGIFEYFKRYLKTTWH